MNTGVTKGFAGVCCVFALLFAPCGFTHAQEVETISPEAIPPSPSGAAVVQEVQVVPPSEGSTVEIETLPPPAGVDVVSPATVVSPVILPEGAAVSEAEEYFRRGVDLYKRDLYLEALSEFNRAIALEPGHTEALAYQARTQAKLDLTSAGIAPAPEKRIDIVDPEAIAPGTAVPGLSAEEIKRDRVRQLLADAVRYMEAQKFSIAVDIYNNALLIDPNNDTAREGLYRASLGASQQSIEETEREKNLDTQTVRRYAEDIKQLPEGADATGIKQTRLVVPEIEETYIAPEEKSLIEKTLDAPVTIEFEQIHVSEIVSFIAEQWEINVVIDQRAVMPPIDETAQQAFPGAVPGAGGFPGAVPGGFPGAPGAFPGGGRRISANGRNRGKCRT